MTRSANLTLTEIVQVGPNWVLGIVMRLLMLGFTITALAGCGSISQQACLATDWTAAGYSDGASGVSVNTHEAYRGACSRLPGSPYDQAAYDAGWIEGLKLYCLPENGFEIGVQGQTYDGICSQADEASFLSAYTAGRTLFVLERAVAQHEARIRQAKYDLRNIEHRIAQTKIAIIAPDMSRAERKQLRLELDDLASEQETILSDIEAIQGDRHKQREKLNTYRAQMMNPVTGVQTVLQATAVKY